MTQEIIKIFIIEQIQRKLMTIFFFKFKKPYFWPIFGPFPKFLQQKSFDKKPGYHTQLRKGFGTKPKFTEI